MKLIIFHFKDHNNQTVTYCFNIETFKSMISKTVNEKTTDGLDIYEVIISFDGLSKKLQGFVDCGMIYHIQYELNASEDDYEEPAVIILYSSINGLKSNNRFCEFNYAQGN